MGVCSVSGGFVDSWDVDVCERVRAIRVVVFSVSERLKCSPSNTTFSRVMGCLVLKCVISSFD